MYLNYRVFYNQNHSQVFPASSLTITFLLRLWWPHLCTLQSSISLLASLSSEMFFYEIWIQIHILSAEQGHESSAMRQSLCWTQISKMWVLFQWPQRKWLPRVWRLFFRLGVQSLGALKSWNHFCNKFFSRKVEQWEVQNLSQTLRGNE